MHINYTVVISSKVFVWKLQVSFCLLVALAVLVESQRGGGGGGKYFIYIVL
jgi:hypothetical protein